MLRALMPRRRPPMLGKPSGPPPPGSGHSHPYREENSRGRDRRVATKLRRADFPMTVVARRGIIAGMAPPIASDPAEWEQIRRAGQGDGRCLEELFTRYRARLRRMVKLRLDRRAPGPRRPVRRPPGGLPRRRPPARRLPARRRRCRSSSGCACSTGQQLVDCTASHLGAEMRDAGQEVSLYRGALPEASSAALAAQLLGRLTAPSQAGRPGRAEAPPPGGAQRHGPARPRGAGPAALRAAEQRRDRRGARPRRESAASNRYVRALERLKRHPRAARPAAVDRPGRSGHHDRPTTPPSDRDPVGRLAEEFLAPLPARRAAGASPSTPSGTPSWPTNPRPVPGWW